MVEIRIVVVGAYESFSIGPLSNDAKILLSFSVGGWACGITWEEGGVDTCGGTKVVIGYKITFYTCKV